jgi:Zn-dependent alcohol dehydrogenase
MHGRPLGECVMDLRPCLERRNGKCRNHRNHKNKGKMEEENRGMKNTGNEYQCVFGTQETIIYKSWQQKSKKYHLHLEMD